MNLEEILKSKAIRTLRRFVKLETVYLVASILLMGGLINYLLRADRLPPGALTTLYMSTQTVVETFVYLVVIILGFAGAYMLYRPIEPSSNNRDSFLVYVVGASLLTLSVVLVLYLAYLKPYP